MTALIAALAAALVLIPGSTASAAAAASDVMAKSPVLASSLLDDAGVAPGRAHAAGDGSVRVRVEGTSVATATAAVQAVGGAVERVGATYLEAMVARGALVRLSQQPGVTLVREPERFHADASCASPCTSEGVATTNASTWQSGGQRGAGERIGIVDVGFKGYAAKIGANGELGAHVETKKDFCQKSDGDHFEDEQHGSAVAEVIHDVAPDATLILICVQDEGDFDAAGTYLHQLNSDGDASNDIKIVNASIGLTQAGRGDGSGAPDTPAGVVRRTRRDDGVLWTVSAGNEGDVHKTLLPLGFSQACDTPPPGYPRCLARIVLGPSLTNTTFTVPAFSVAEVSVKWDAWPTTDQDFDLYVFHKTSSAGDKFEWDDLATDTKGGLDCQGPSAACPGAPNARPTETELVGNSSSAPQTYDLVIAKGDSNDTSLPRFDLTVEGASTLVGANADGSVSEPASSPSALTVGAHCYANGQIEPFSSRGPTIDNRIKPDVSGPDGTSSSVYGKANGCDLNNGSGFLGTSASAPHVAGVAALLAGESPALQGDPGELQAAIERLAVDSGTTGLDATYGAGLLHLPDTVAPQARPAARGYSAIAPVRILDTRTGLGGTNGKLAASQEVVLDVRSRPEVPANATAVVLNVTSADATGSGYIGTYPDLTPNPNTSSLNYTAGSLVSNQVTATIGTNGKIRFFTLLPTNLVVDLSGFYGPTGTAGLTNLSAPKRALDTRSSVGGHTGRFAAGETYDLPLAGTTLDGQAIPPDATAILLNITVDDPAAAGYVTAFPAGGSVPTVSNLNFTAHTTVPNLVNATVGNGGKVSIYAFVDTTVVVDVVGFYRAGSGLSYVALPNPRRAFDTRNGNGYHLGPVGQGEAATLELGHLYGLPNDAAAAALNVTAVTPTTNSYLTVYPGDQAKPASSSLNYRAGQIVANAIVSRTGSNGLLLYNFLGSVHVVADLTGYFR